METTEYRKVVALLKIIDVKGHKSIKSFNLKPVITGSPILFSVWLKYKNVLFNYVFIEIKDTLILYPCVSRNCTEKYLFHLS